MTENQKEKARYELIVKGNDLVRKSRYSLTVAEQKIVLYLLSKIKPDSTETEYRFDIKDFAETVGIEYRENLFTIKENIKSIRDKSSWIKSADGKSEILFSWISEAEIIPDTGIVNISIGKKALPYLISLKKDFLQYPLIAVLALRSKFSIRLYEIFKSYQYLGHYEVSLQELRYLMMIEENEYKKTNDFRRFVIDKPLEEINTFTDLEVEYQPIKTGRAITGFYFTITQPEEWSGKYSATQLYLDGKLPSVGKRNKELSQKAEELKEQMKLWED